MKQALENKFAPPLLVADIGGTNARFATVIGTDDSGQYIFSQQQHYLCDEFADFTQVISEYLHCLDVKPHFACIAVAGPVNNGQVAMTNQNWLIQESDISTEFGFKAFSILNDFEALSLSLNHLHDNDLSVICAAKPISNKVKSVIGAGTGLGVAALVTTENTVLSLPSEGGHVAFAPYTEREKELLDIMQIEKDYVSAEDILSGEGLRNIYQSLLRLDKMADHDISAAAISELAVKERDPHAQESLSIFCAVLGSVAGDAVLTYGAKGGLYLGGGILPKIEDFFHHSDFIERFKNKGKMSCYLKDVPIFLINHDHPTLLGAAQHLEQLYLK
ncbi:MAG: glucokinase [Agarilytica sp.]